MRDDQHDGARGGRIFLCGEVVDMRKGMDGLSALVLGRLQRDSHSGEVFVFLGHRSDRLKALCWDRNGSRLCCPRLARGRFLAPRIVHADGHPSAVEISASDWQLLLDGIVVRNRVLLRKHGREVEAESARVFW